MGEKDPYYLDQEHLLSVFGLFHGEQPLNGFSHDPSLSRPHYPMDDDSQDKVNMTEQPIHINISPPSSIPDLEMDSEDRHCACTCD